MEVVINTEVGTPWLSIADESSTSFDRHGSRLCGYFIVPSVD